jgi:hypothetical protein
MKVSQLIAILETYDAEATVFIAMHPGESGVCSALGVAVHGTGEGAGAGAGADYPREPGEKQVIIAERVWLEEALSKAAAAEHRG